MAQSGGSVLPFLRGIDFTDNNFSDEQFPAAVKKMANIRWLKLDKTNLDWIPEEMGKLTKLESISANGNGLVSLHGEVGNALPNLRHLIVRHNRIKTCGIPENIFHLEELQVVDLSHNCLVEIPQDLSKSTSLLVLNLSHNQISTIPTQLFVNLTQLLHLDLSGNKLETLPPQMRRLASLQILVLNDNPMAHNQMRQLPSLTSLVELHMRNTGRSQQNLPCSLAPLVSLVELDMSHNALTSVPSALYTIPNLRRLNLSHNQLSELAGDIGECWKKMDVLKLSHNLLKALPNSICKLSALRRLFVNDNLLDFDGIPAGIGKLGNLEYVMAAFNNLEMIPEGITRCGRLKKLILSNNRLVTLPDAIHLMTDLEVLDLAGNPDIVVPPKPKGLTHVKKGAGVEFYNVDFSLNAQLLKAGASPTCVPSETTPVKDPIARKMRLRKRRDTDDQDKSGSAKVLKGMSDLARDKYNLRVGTTSGESGDLSSNANALETNVKPKRWDESLVRPSLDYSDFFEDEDGQYPGLTIWEIENFVPNKIPEELHGKFYEGDCYIVLHTIEQESANHPNWQIFYWIGQECTLDKKACSAIHAVNLRNYLGAQCRTIREEQADESEEFSALFPEGILYIEGGRTASGFYTVEETESIPRMFRLHQLCDWQRHLHMESVPILRSSLDPRFIFILDSHNKIFVWTGSQSKNTMKQKARLLAEKINKDEHKNKSTVLFYNQNHEEDDFLQELHANISQDSQNVPPPSPPPVGDELAIVEHAELDDFKPTRPVIYKVVFGTGYLELPQIDFRGRKVTSSILETKNVYIMDCITDVFVWLGRKSARLVRAAAQKLALEIFEMIKRPPHSIITRCLEGNEPQIFKCKFSHWDDVIAVDFTRTAESVNRTGANLEKWMSNQEIKTDLAALFMPRQPSFPLAQSLEMETELNSDLELIEPFVLEGKKFVRLPEGELGHFFSEDCYVFLCRYWVPLDDGGDEVRSTDENVKDGDDDQSSLKSGRTSRSNTPDASNDDFHCVVYFWQGRDASNMGWLTFTFTLQKKFEAHFKDKMEVIRQHQQQENLKFLSHFHRKIIIHQGKRVPSNRRSDPQAMELLKTVRLYQLRANGNAITTRCVQVKAHSLSLNSAFCFLNFVPYKKTSAHEEEEEEEEGEEAKNANDKESNQEEEEEENQKIESSAASDSMGIVYVWIGSQCSADDAEIAETIASDYLCKSPLSSETFSVSVVHEGAEPELFWLTLGGRNDNYEKEADFINYLRLFRCSNDKGYFSISEKCADFCQDDLADDDIMILDNGTRVFIWAGSRSSDVEVKLAFKSAQVYVQHVRAKQPDRPRQLLLSLKGKESRKFTACFHGWTKHKEFKDPRKDERSFLMAIAKSEQESHNTPE